MNILLLNAFHSGSHQTWAESIQKYSQHNVEILSLKGKYWKWRMHGAAISFAEQLRGETRKDIDLVLCTDMLDLNTFKSLTSKLLPNAVYAIYFHENQITYPWKANSSDVQHQRDMHYAFMNYSSALGADKVYFNSRFHQEAFIEELGPFLKSYPDERNLHLVDSIAAKSETLYLGNDLKYFDQFERESTTKPCFVWNHRHEHDKNPEEHFQALEALAKAGQDFDLIVLGESFANEPEVFGEAKAKLKGNIVHWGYANSRKEYAALLKRASHILVTSNHDFFGQSLVEAAYAGAFPILPNRLVYPEHFTKQEALFYSEDDNLVEVLKSCIARQSTDNQRLLRYDWSQMIDEYDEAFSVLIHT